MFCVEHEVRLMLEDNVRRDIRREISVTNAIIIFLKKLSQYRYLTNPKLQFYVFRD